MKMALAGMGGGDGVELGVLSQAVVPHACAIATVRQQRTAGNKREERNTPQHERDNLTNPDKEFWRINWFRIKDF